MVFHDQSIYTHHTTAKTWWQVIKRITLILESRLGSFRKPTSDDKLDHKCCSPNPKCGPKITAVVAILHRTHARPRLIMPPNPPPGGYCSGMQQLRLWSNLGMEESVIRVALRWTVII